MNEVYRKKPKTRIKPRAFIYTLVLLLNAQFVSAGTGKASFKEDYYNPTFLLLLFIALFLLMVILTLTNAVQSAIKWKNDQDKKNSGTALKTILVLAATSFFGTDLYAQSDTVSMAKTTAASWGGLSATTFFAMIGIIAFELFVILMLRGLLKQILGIRELDKELAAAKALKKTNQPTLMEKLNASVSIEKEADIMFEHEYDGIRELDNNLPPWWKYGFYITIAWACIYLVYYHVTKTGNLQIAEYKAELKQAERDLAEYRKKAANLVDENNVTMLTDEAAIAEGKALFITNCKACHGGAGEGGVGPNLTDAYWLHGGGIKNVFGTIKYGYPEKGMKSWQQDLGARQIHMVASYIMTLKGTNPPNGKAKQGELYNEPAADSVKTK